MPAISFRQSPPLSCGGPGPFALSHPTTASSRRDLPQRRATRREGTMRCGLHADTPSRTEMEGSMRAGRASLVPLVRMPDPNPGARGSRRATATLVPSQAQCQRSPRRPGTHRAARNGCPQETRACAPCSYAPIYFRMRSSITLASTRIIRSSHLPGDHIEVEVRGHRTSAHSRCASTGMDYAHLYRDVIYLVQSGTSEEA